MFKRLVILAWLVAAVGLFVFAFAPHSGRNATPPVERGHFWEIRAVVSKYHGNGALSKGARPYAIVVRRGNVLCNAGITRLLNLLIGAPTTQAFDAAHIRLGVGNSTTAVTAADTDLGAAAGSTNRLFNLVDQAPSVSGQTLTLHATFATGDANFAWQEWGIDQGTAQGTTVVAPFLDHKIASLGTKTSSSSWALTVTITIS